MSSSNFNLSFGGYMTYGNADWATNRGSATGSVGGDTDLVNAHNMKNGGYYLERGYAFFDTTNLPDNATVSAAILQIYGRYKSSEYGAGLYVVGVTTSSSSSLATSDYNISNWSGATQSTAISDASMNATGWNNLSVAPTYINKTGVTKYGFIGAYDWTNSAPPVDRTSGDNYQFYKTTQVPVLVVTWTTPPAVTTGAASSITDTTATLAGTVTDYGGGTVSNRGVCWATGANPTTANANATTGSDAISVSATGLTKNTLYHYRAFVTTENSTQYGADQTFTTDNDPAVTTGAVTLLQPISATLGGNITSNGNATVTTAGVCWATTANPTTASSKTATATVTGAYTVNTGNVLLPGFLYHYRAYVTTAVSTQYGADAAFRTSGASFLLNFI